MIPVAGIPEIEAGDDLRRAARAAGGRRLEDGDVVVVAQKVVSKAEGRVVRLDDLEPSRAGARARGRRRSPPGRGDPARGPRVVRVAAAAVIAETRHGFVCASAGVDASNAQGQGTLVLLPLDPTRPPRGIRERLRELTGRDVGVIVSDSFGRPFRQGTTDVAIGAAGLTALLDLRGDARPLRLRAQLDADRRRRRARGRGRARDGQGRRHPGGGRPRARLPRRRHRARDRHAAASATSSARALRAPTLQGASRPPVRI